MHRIVTIFVYSGVPACSVTYKSDCASESFTYMILIAFFKQMGVFETENHSLFLY